MKKEKLKDELLDHVTGGVTNDAPVPWICQFCGTTVMVRVFKDKERHLDRCPNNPYPDWRSVVDPYKCEFWWITEEPGPL